MSVRGLGIFAGVVVAVAVLSGCGGGNVEMNPALTWEEAKEGTMLRAAEIAALVPAEQVSSVDQRQTGTLFDCGPTQKSWNSSTLVTLIEGADAEQIVKSIESHYQDRDFTVKNRLDISGNYDVHLIAPDGVEGYLVGVFGDNEILISYGSSCFTPPDDRYLGGDW